LDKSALLIFAYSVVLVHGLRGHPRRSWESPRSSRVEELPRVDKNDRQHLRNFLRSKLSPNRTSNERQGNRPLPNFEGPQFPEAKDATVFWPEDLLAPSLPNARILIYGYNADAFGGLFQANNKNSISQHGNDLMVKLERAVHNGVRHRLSKYMYAYRTDDCYSDQLYSLPILWVALSSKMFVYP